MTETQEALENLFELSPTQRLVARQVAGTGKNVSAALQVSCVVPCKETLDELLTRLDLLAGQYEVLRTKIEHIEGVLGEVQIIEEQPCHRVEWLDLDLSNLAETNSVIAISQIIDQNSHLFHLEPGENFKVFVFPLDQQQMCLLIVFDFRLMDSQPGGYLLQELLGRGSEQLRSSAEEILQYVDVAMWLDDLSKEPEAASGQEYWRQYLTSERAELQLPCVNGKVANSAVENNFQLQGAISSSLEFGALSERLGSEQLDTEAYLLACWQAILCRYSGQGSFVHFVNQSGREMDELKPVVGLLERALPLCEDDSSDLTLRDLILRNIRTLKSHNAQLEYFTADIFEDSDSWFESLIQRPGVCFSYQDQSQLAETGLSANAVVRRGGYGLLHLQVNRAKDEITLQLEGGSAVNEAILSAILNAYAHLVHSGIDALEQAIEQLELIEAEVIDTMAIQLAHEPDLRPAVEETVLDLFAVQVQNQPDRIAVVDENEEISFAQLDSMSNRVACHLRSIGVDQTQPVMLVLNRSSEMVAAILGVLKAGCGYLPIDPRQPADRMAFIIEDACVNTIVTSAECLQFLPEDATGTVLLAEALAQEDIDRELPSVQSSDLAYVIYTSGSTGLPKGVAINHANLNASVQSRLLYYGDPPPAYLMLSSYGFDSSVAALYHSICSGGSLHLLKDGMERNVDLVADYILEHEISMLLALPTLYGLILDALGSRQASSLSGVIVAGEPCRTHDLARHFESHPGTRLYNEYGPTEGCVWATVHECQLDDGGRPFVPIGKAIGSARAVILDTNGRPVPFGAVGELWIAGHGISVGYLNRPGLTEEKFRPLTLEGSESAAYKTGDRVVADGDGNILFLGRVDQQVKLRGYRIELEEIEAVLCRHHAVDEAAVVVLEHGTSNEKRLAAFIVASMDGDEAGKDAIRGYLAEQLPEYMLPQQLAIIEALPKNANGKVDRNVLSMSSSELFDETAEYVAPETETQMTVARIWNEILESETRIGQRDDFFMLGGNSILVPRVVQALRSKLSVSLPFVAVFENPVLADLADVIDVLLAQENLNRADAGLDEDREEIVF